MYAPVWGVAPLLAPWQYGGMDTITWNGTPVTRAFTAYCSRKAYTTRSGKFGHTMTLPAEYAVKDQSGLIVKRFDTLDAARAYAAERMA